MVEEPGKRAGPGRSPAPAGRTARPRQAEVARLAGVSQATPERLRRWLADGATAFVAEETDTGGAWRALRRAVTEAHIDCPRDASLALLGSPPADLSDDPEPTGFDIPRSRLGAAAVRMLAALVAGEEATEPLVACAFRPGATAGPPPSAHRGMDAAVKQLRADSLDVRDEDVARLSPFVRHHIDMLGR